MQDRKIDIAIVGGGLAGGLLALALAKTRPAKQLLLIEEGERFGGNHVWSYLDTDISRYYHFLTLPLVSARWSGFDVHFPGRSRTFSTQYRSITGEKLDEELRARLPAEALMTGTKAVAATQDSVTLADGKAFAAGGVIDARGARGLPYMSGGWHKFAGRVLRLSQPHGVERPIVMDACVDQLGDCHFMRCLPFSETEILIEDSYYSDDAELDLKTMHGRIAAYAASRGWRLAEVMREHAGALPVIAQGDFEAFWHFGDEGVARAGMRAAVVHPLTGYSLPDAVRFARHIAMLRDLSGASLAQASYAWARAHWRRGRYYRMAARMLFGAVPPDRRYKVLERFYSLPPSVIERVHGGRATRGDGIRMLLPPSVGPLLATLASLAGRGQPMARLGSFE